MQTQFRTDGSGATNQLEPALREEEAARIIGVAVKTLRNWRVQGVGPRFVATGRKLVRYRPSDLRAYQESNLCRSTSQARSDASQRGFGDSASIARTQDVIGCEAMGMKLIIKYRKKEINVQASERIGSLNEPNVPECKPKQVWRVRLVQLQMTGRYEIEFQFRNRLGKIETLRVDAAFRSDCDRIRKELDSRNARLPFNKKAALAFVEELVRKTPATAFVACASPVFCDAATGFVMPTRRYGSARGKFIWDAENAPPEFGAIQGEFVDYERGVLIPAESSPYLTFAMLIPLASAALGYVLQKRQVRLLPETAIYHFAGESSSGKTSLARVAQSEYGPPTIETDYEATDRGIAEQAYRRSLLALVIDDTESAGLGDQEIWAKIQKFAQRLPSGRVKAISGRAKRSELPELNWTVFGISSGPESLAQLAVRLQHRRQGDRVRLLDIVLPPLSRGGIFGSAATATGKRPEDSAALIKKVEDTIVTCHGVLFDKWISYLVSNDVADRIVELVEGFVKAMAGGENGLEQRFARKFAVPYAAGMVAVEAQLVPWSADWIRRAVEHCYLNSRNVRDKEGAAARLATKRLARALTNPTPFPRFKAQRGRHPRWRQNQIGVRIIDKGRVTTWLAKERLALACGGDKSIGDRMFTKLVEMKFVEASPNASASRQFRVQTAANAIAKVRLWRLNAKKFRAWAGITEQAKQGGP